MVNLPDMPALYQFATARESQKETSRRYISAPMSISLLNGKQKLPMHSAVGVDTLIGLSLQRDGLGFSRNISSLPADYIHSHHMDSIIVFDR
jgi:hypothetical protein